MYVVRDTTTHNYPRRVQQRRSVPVVSLILQYVARIISHSQHVSTVGGLRTSFRADHIDATKHITHAFITYS